MSKPEVSIIMPMRNAGLYVRDALISVLKQQGVALEVIVVDDGSADHSIDEVKSIDDQRIRLIPGPQLGVAAALNTALEAASGEFLTRCDADDFFVPGRLERQLGWLRNHLEFGGVCGGFSTITSKGSWICDLDCGDQAMEITQELLMSETRTSFCTWLARTEVCRRAGGFREYFKIAEDIDLQLRFAELARVWFEPSRTYLYRLHDASATHSSDSRRRMFYDETAREFARQRRATGADDLQRGVPPTPPSQDGLRSNGSREHVQDLMLGAAWDQFEAGFRGKAIHTGIKAILLQPFSLGAWRSFGALALRVQRT